MEVLSAKNFDIEDEDSIGTPRKRANRNCSLKIKDIKEDGYDVPDIISCENLRSGYLFAKYERNELLGTGGFAKVFKVTDLSSGFTYADKIICKEIFKKKKSAREKVYNEISIHRTLEHPNIVQWYKDFEDRKFVHMLMEICTNKTLLHVIKRRKTITEPEARYYLKQIMEGTRYLHLRQVLHRDLKLGNMFLHADMTLKIGDFGLASTFRRAKPGSTCGTPNYIAPEILSKKGYGVSSDIWAIGCMLFAMLCGYPPFETESLSATYKKIAEGDFSIPERSDISAAARNMIEIMLSPDPDMRGHLAMPDKIQYEAEDLFNHPFLDEFTPETLPVSATSSPPDLDHQRTLQSSRSSAMSITGRRLTNEDPGCGSFSPIFSPSAQFGSTLKQKFGSFFDKRTRFIHRVIDVMTMCIDQGEKVCHRLPTFNSLIPVFVSKWVDYSNKFGFGYQLSNNAVGLLFNDSTRMGCTGDRRIVEFYDLKGKSFTFPLNGPNPYGSHDLTVRVEVLGRIISYMENHLHDSGAPLQGMANVNSIQKTLIPQLKKWCRRHDAISMEINNHTIQINHLEKHTKVVLFESSGDVYITLLEQDFSIQTYCFSTLLSLGCTRSLLYWLNLTLPEVRHLADKE